MKVILCALTLLAAAHCSQTRYRPQVGIVADPELDSLVYSLGYRLRVESIARTFSPRTVSDEEFDRIIRSRAKLKTTAYAANTFIPGELKLVGPSVDEEAIVQYAEVVFSRCRRAEIKLIIWGSGGARRLPDGFDPASARAQFIVLARRLADMAGDYGITLALENLNSEETNFINTLSEAYAIASEVDHPRFRVCADIYHMLKEGEPPEAIRAARKLIVHCDLAEKVRRSPPGTHGEDFKPYLEALRSAGFTGNIMLECRWDDLGRQAGPARAYVEKQVAEIY